MAFTRARLRLRRLRRRLQVRRLARRHPPERREYVGVQLARTLPKQANDPGIGARFLIDQVVRLGAPAPQASVLCVGCRNTVELDEFRARGLTDVVGIDLFSTSPEILVMDMHRMEFPDNRFDVVYASHSLEHSDDLAAAVQEIVRVARAGAVVGAEVPVRHKGSDADMIVFAGLDDLRGAFAPHIERILWEEEQPALSPTNAQGSAVARLVFTLGQAAKLD